MFDQNHQLVFIFKAIIVFLLKRGLWSNALSLRYFFFFKISSSTLKALGNVDTEETNILRRTKKNPCFYQSGRDNVSFRKK